MIRSLFARARAASPCILFFDEIDAIATNREDDGSSVDVSSRILTTFLNEMDGISSGGDTRSNILVVACTNRLETLDAALLRPGRLDEHVLLPMPAASDVADMLELHLSKVPRSDDVNVIELAELLVELGASGADVEGMCRDTCCCVIREATHLTPDLVVTYFHYHGVPSPSAFNSVSLKIFGSTKPRMTISSPMTLGKNIAVDAFCLNSHRPTRQAICVAVNQFILFLPRV